MLFDNHPGDGFTASIYAHDGGAAFDLDNPNGARAGFMINDKQPGLQKIDEPPLRKPNPQ
jgi:hypothetical protein